MFFTPHLFVRIGKKCFRYGGVQIFNLANDTYAECNGQILISYRVLLRDPYRQIPDFLRTLPR